MLLYIPRRGFLSALYNDPRIELDNDDIWKKEGTHASRSNFPQPPWTREDITKICSSHGKTFDDVKHFLNCYLHVNSSAKKEGKRLSPDHPAMKEYYEWEYRKMIASTVPVLNSFNSEKDDKSTVAQTSGLSIGSEDKEQLRYVIAISNVLFSGVAIFFVVFLLGQQLTRTLEWRVLLGLFSAFLVVAAESGLLWIQSSSYTSPQKRILQTKLSADLNESGSDESGKPKKFRMDRKKNL